VSGSSEAIETALKMARQYLVEIGEPERAHVIARRWSYQGATLGALAGAAAAWRRAHSSLSRLITSARDTLVGFNRRARATHAAAAAQTLEDKGRAPSIKKRTACRKL
jgi:adenosylmethionine-8-amino-7-oxononanoate aminotransferase